MAKTRNKRIEVIMNPASGQGQPNLRLFNRYFRKAGYTWGLSITNAAGDAAKFAKKLSKTADIIVVYGGDGTVVEVASGMIGSSTPLGIIPGGTGNVVSVELGIPSNQSDACELIVGKAPSAVTDVDIAKTPDGKFLLQAASFGLPAQMIQKADRKAKNKFGQLAYIVGAVAAIQNPVLSTYYIEVDGKKSESQGVACIICNAGNMGIAGVKLDSDVVMYDGKMDVFVLDSAEITSIFSIVSNIVNNNQVIPHIEHWKGTHIVVKTKPDQLAHIDGELYDSKVLDLKVIPQSIKIITPTIEVSQ